MATTLKWIEVRGFRSFGVVQRLDFSKPLALVWGGNSQGKTSVAEAVEFLLTGSTVRRELLGGDKGEYDDSLRNAYHPEDEEVSVTACIVDADGAERSVKRTLDCDYSRKQDCETTLTVDGVEQVGVSSLGITLAEPPLRAPVLLQHSVRYALSSRPTDRLAYFKALLEVADLDTLAAALTSVVDGLRLPDTPLVNDMAAVAGAEAFGAEIGSLLADKPTVEVVRTGVATALRVALVQLTGAEPEHAQPFDERVASLEVALEAQRQQRFDFSAWRPGSSPARLTRTTLPAVLAYADASRTANAEVERLRTLFEAVLAVPTLRDLDVAVECPVCQTPDALTPGRIAELRARVREASGFAKAQLSASDELHSVRSQLENTLRATGELVPHAADFNDDEHGAAAASIASILGTEPQMDKTREALGILKEQRDALKDAGEEAMREIADALRSVRAGESVDAGRLGSLLSNVDAAAEEAVSARSRQLAEASRVLVPVREELDKQAGTSTASAVFRLAQHVDDLVVTLRKRYATNAVRAEYAAALKDVDKAKLAVFNEKFSGMSDEISRWWKLLRPDEPVAFHRAAPRGTGRRFVAMEAKLSSAGREEIRDALGVLSDSQLNALGVSAFLARAVLQQTRLIVLDDPLQSGDDEHRDTFIDAVVPELLEAGLQVVLTTYDSQFKRLLTNAQQLDGFTVTLDEPTAGTVVVKGTDTAEALLREAKSFLKDTASLRDTGAGRLRTAAERVAKEILVVKRAAAGERASLADYNKQSLDKLVPLLLEHLTHEGECGKWRNVSPRLSPGAHDDEPPAKNTLLVVYQHLLESHRQHVRDAKT